MKLTCRLLGHEVSWRIDRSGTLLPFCLRCKLAILHSKGSRPPVPSDINASDHSNTEPHERDQSDAPV
ncbi:MAG: hypothetical protein JO145_14455, partial [Acidobacteriaceae bacterium]|nr:hypothetical protein [Acidobacteriaceae bacterium]